LPSSIIPPSSSSPSTPRLGGLMPINGSDIITLAGIWRPFSRLLMLFGCPCPLPPSSPLSNATISTFRLD
jgi:hypothetical protein